MDSGPMKAMKCSDTITFSSFELTTIFWTKLRRRSGVAQFIQKSVKIWCGQQRTSPVGRSLSGKTKHWIWSKLERPTRRISFVTIWLGCLKWLHEYLEHFYFVQQQYLLLPFVSWSSICTYIPGWFLVFGQNLLQCPVEESRKKRCLAGMRQSEEFLRRCHHKSLRWSTKRPRSCLEFPRTYCVDHRMIDFDQQAISDKSWQFHNVGSFITVTTIMTSKQPMITLSLSECLIICNSSPACLRPKKPCTNYGSLYCSTSDTTKKWAFWKTNWAWLGSRSTTQ